MAPSLLRLFVFELDAGPDWIARHDMHAAADTVTCN